MRGTADSVLWDTDALCADLLDDEGFLATLGRARGRVFTDANFDRLYPSGRGRPSHPPSVMAALLLAQLFFGVSDREAERRSRLDLSWKAALGLPLDHKGIPHACLVEFRARLVKAGMEALLHEKLLAVAKEAKVLGRRRAIDSTGIADSVLTQDTVTLLRSATRRCLDRLGDVDAQGAVALRTRLHRDDYDAAGKPQIVWADPAARSALVRELFADAQTVIDASAATQDPQLAAAATLLGVVAAQDLDIEHSADGPQVSIRQAVAPDRVISVVDPEARHGHRSRADRYDGYKLHLSVDLESDLLVAVDATKATEADASVVEELLDADPGAVDEVLADTAYGSGETREMMVARDIELLAPAQPISNRNGLFGKDAFRIDLQSGTASCPAGQTVSPSRHQLRRNPARPLIFRFDAQTCAACPLREKCTTSPRGRIVSVGPQEALLQQARAARWTLEFRDRYRHRVRVERKAAQVKFRSPKLPWRGVVKAKAWIKIKAAALNLDRLGRLGLVGT